MVASCSYLEKRLEENCKKRLELGSLAVLEMHVHVFRTRTRGLGVKEKTMKAKAKAMA